MCEVSEMSEVSDITDIISVVSEYETVIDTYYDDIHHEDFSTDFLLSCLVDSPNCLNNLSDDCPFFDNSKFIIDVVSQGFDTYKNIYYLLSERLKNDHSFLTELAIIQQDIINYYPDCIFEDTELVIDLITSGVTGVFDLCSHDIKNDSDVMNTYKQMQYSGIDDCDIDDIINLFRTINLN